MRNFHFPHRNPESLREERLVFDQMKSPEVLPEWHVLLQEHAEIGSLEGVVEAAGHNNAAFEAFINRKDLDAKQRKMIEGNLRLVADRAGERTELTAKARSMAERIQRVFGPKGAPDSPAASPSASGEKGVVERSWEWMKEKGQQTFDWAKEHPVAIGSTLGVGLLFYGLWRWWKGGGKKEEKSEKKESLFWRVLKWIPVVGLVAVAGYGIYEGVQWMKKNFSSLEKAKDLLAKAKEEAKHLYDRAFKGNEWEKYKISEENFQHAQSKFRETRKSPDEKKIRQYFGLQEGQSSPTFEEFMKDMHAKYDVRPERGITYARADAALENYEESIGASLQQLGQWLEAHAGEIGLITVVAYRLGLFRIRDILRAGESVAKTAVKISKEFVMMGLRHPIISLLGMGAAFLTERAVIAASKHTYLPENFSEIGKVLAGDQPLVDGDALPATVALSIQSGRDDLKTLTGNLSAWVDGALSSFYDVVFNKVPEALGLKKWETVQRIHENACQSLKRELESRRSDVNVTTAATSAETGALYKEALERLEIFKKAFLDHRTEHVTESNEPESTLENLRNVLTELHIENAEEGGIIRWKAQNGTMVDLCVDPRIKDPDRVHALSIQMHEVKDETNFTHVVFREFYHLREKLERTTERGEWGLPGGKVVATMVGGVIYFTDPENQEEFWMAPVHLAKDLFPGTTWTEFAADAVGATTNAAIISFDIAAFARLKRLMVGGDVLLKKKSFLEMGWAVNPFTAPFRIVRDIARGMVDVSIARNLKTLTGEGGRLANILFGKSGIRPEWIGIIENSMDEKELQYVAKLMGEGEIQGKNPLQIKDLLRSRVMEKIKNIDWRPLRELFGKTHIKNYPDLYDAIGLWYTERTGLAKSAERVAKTMDQTMDVARAGWRKLYDTIALVLKDESGGVSIPMAKIEEVLSKVHIPPALVDAFAKSRGAALMLVNAVRNGGGAAVEYLVKLGTIAQKIAPVAGKAALGLDALICVVEISMNRMRIAGTDNQSLKELYALQDRVSVANAVAGTAMGVTWCAVGWAPASTAWYAVGASTFAPAVVAFAAGKYMHGKAEEVAETWIMEQRDWEKKKPGELRQKMEELAPGQRTYWQGWAGGTRAENWARWAAMSSTDFHQWEAGVERNIQDANSASRYKITRAYIARMTDLPPLQGESDSAYTKRFARFQQDQIGYCSDQTQGKFDTPQAAEFRNAHTHAELMEISRSLKALGKHQMIRVVKGDASGDLVEQEFDLARYVDFGNAQAAIDGVRPLTVINAYREDRQRNLLLQTAAMREALPGDATSMALQDFDLQHFILMEVRHDLSICDRNIRNNEHVSALPGWEWTGGLDKARNITRFGMSVALRSCIRDEAHRLRAKTDVTTEDLKAAILRATALLDNPDYFRKFYDLGLQEQGARQSEIPEDQEVLLTVPWLMKNLFRDALPERSLVAGSIGPTAGDQHDAPRVRAA